MEITTTVSTPLVYSEVPQITFSWFDYALFIGMLGMSTLIGIYFGCCGGKQDTTDEYLLGGKNMKIIPVALSLVASHISGITILAVPADVYTYGSNYIWVSLCIIIVSFITCYVYLPVFFKLQLTSMYEYLNLRFDRKIRTLASFLYTMAIFLYNPIVVYIPALALSQATGINVHFITPAVCAICIFYTSIGGLKAVVWTDALQFAGMIGSTAAVFFIGASSVGGFSVVWEKSVEGHRLDLFNFKFDATIRDGIWALMLGGTIHWAYLGCLNQGSIQKYLALPTIGHAKRAICFYVAGMVLLKSISVFTGDIMYAKYADCDPLSTKQVSRHDQLLPYFVMDVAGKIPGLPGVFIAGIFSAALSTLSATLNTVSGTIYEDFISPFMPPGITQKTASNILKLIVVISGIICTAMVFIVEHMGGLLPFATALQGITGGPLFGLFTLGMLFPMANSKGALYGGAGSLLFLCWVVFGNQYYTSRGLTEDFSKPVSTEGCPFHVNTTLTASSTPVELPFVLYRISFWFNTVMGAVLVIIIGLAVSWFTNKDHRPVHPDLISPIAQFLLPRGGKPVSSPPEYLTVDKALHVVFQNSEKEPAKNTDE